MRIEVNRRQALGVLSAAGGALRARTVAAEPVAYAPRAGVRGRMTGALAAVEALQLEGTCRVFGVPGAQNNEFWDAMKTRGLPYLLTTNESAASVMADGAARATGSVGVFAVVPGPGLTNAMTGIGEALLDSVPLVGIVTDVDRGPEAKAFQVHSLPGAAILRPVCKIVLEVRHQGEIPTRIHQAFQVARSGEPGPAAVVIPFPFYNMVWHYDDSVPPPLGCAFDEPAYGQALRLLADRNRRVGIYAGMGCFEAAPQLQAVADLLQAPVATSVSGKGAISDGHPLAVGWGYGPQGTRAAERAFKDVDLVLAVGVRYSEVSTANYSIPEHDALIHVDANPSNLGRNVPTTVALPSDAGYFFSRLLADGRYVCREADPRLHRKIAKDRAVDRAKHQAVEIPCAVDPMLVMVHLRRRLGWDDLIFVDVTASTHWAAEAIDVPGPRRYFAPTNNQSMGWSIAAAIGAQAVRPDRAVVAIVGDGCFLMSGLETSTAARAGLPVKFFVLDDGAYHYMQMLQKPVYRRTTATELAHVDWPAFAQAMGLRYLRIGQNAELEGGIAAALATPGPVLVRVPISYEGRELRWLNALKSSYLDKLTPGQQVRMARRVVTRSVTPFKEND